MLRDRTGSSGVGGGARLPPADRVGAVVSGREVVGDDTGGALDPGSGPLITGPEHLQPVEDPPSDRGGTGRAGGGARGLALGVPGDADGDPLGPQESKQKPGHDQQETDLRDVDAHAGRVARSTAAPLPAAGILILGTSVEEIVERTERLRAALDLADRQQVFIFYGNTPAHLSFMLSSALDRL